MAYQKKNNGFRAGFANQQPYNPNGQYNQYPQQQNGYRGQAQAKKSGAKYSLIKDGTYKGYTIINAWNKSRGKGLITAKVAPYKGSKEYTAETSGATYITLIAEVNYRNTGVTKLVPCSMNKATKVIVLSEIGMVISPNGSGITSGGHKVTGYFGKFSR
ncbi:MAG: hypothetical protein RH981_18965 [Arenibacter sp.]